MAGWSGVSRFRVREGERGERTIRHGRSLRQLGVKEGEMTSRGEGGLEEVGSQLVAEGST